MRKIFTFIISTQIFIRCTVPIIIPFGTPAPTSFTFEQKTLKVDGSCILLLPRTKNVFIRTALTYKPSNDNLKKLNEIKFESLTIGYNFYYSTKKNDKIKIYSGQLKININEIINDEVLFASSELFSFQDYNWKWEDVPLGIQADSIGMVITSLKLGSSERKSLTELFEGLQFQFKIVKSETRFKSLSRELIRKNIYPNREAFEMLFKSNSKIFYEIKDQLGVKDLDRIQFPSNESPNLTIPILESFNFTTPEMAELKRQLSLSLKDVQLYGVANKCWDKTYGKLKEISIFFETGEKSDRLFNKETKDLIISETKFIVKSLKELNNADAKISDGRFENLTNTIDHIASLVQFLNSPPKPKSRMNSKQSFNQILPYFFDRASSNLYAGTVYVSVNTLKGSVYDNNLAYNYVVKCIPSSRKNEDLKKLDNEGVLFKFTAPTTPTANYLPPYSYYFWVEDKNGNRIPFYNDDLSRDQGREIDILQTQSKFEMLMRYTFNWELPIKINFSLEP